MMQDIYASYYQGYLLQRMPPRVQQCWRHFYFFLHLRCMPMPARQAASALLLKAISLRRGTFDYCDDFYISR